MKRTLGLLIVGLLLVACGSQGVPSPPRAAIAGPLCVVAPGEVLFDASGSQDVDADIDRYIFRIGHRNPPVVTDAPHLAYRLKEPFTIGGRYEPMPVTVTVVDTMGLEATASIAIWVVSSPEQCATVGQPDPDAYFDSSDGLVPDSQGLDTWDQELADDVLEEVEPRDLLETSSDFVSDIPPDFGTDFVEPDVIEPDMIPPDDIPQDTVVTNCPNIAGKWTVRIRCQGNIEAVLDLQLNQTECSVSDTFAVVYGNFEGEMLVMKSDFDELKINDCSGPVLDTSEFVLECTSECQTEYTRLEP